MGAVCGTASDHGGPARRPVFPRRAPDLASVAAPAVSIFRRRLRCAPGTSWWGGCFERSPGVKSYPRTAAHSSAAAWCWS